MTEEIRLTPAEAEVLSDKLHVATEAITAIPNWERAPPLMHALEGLEMLISDLAGNGDFDDEGEDPDIVFELGPEPIKSGVFNLADPQGGVSFAYAAEPVFQTKPAVAFRPIRMAAGAGFLRTEETKPVTVEAVLEGYVVYGFDHPDLTAFKEGDRRTVRLECADGQRRFIGVPGHRTERGWLFDVSEAEGMEFEPREKGST